MSDSQLAALLIVQLICSLAACRALGWLCSRMRQPLVVAEMVAGFLLGPSLLGWLTPDLHGRLFPAARRCWCRCFFVYAGLNTHLLMIDSWRLWLMTGVVFLTACVGKGLATLGLQRGLITVTMFTMLALMAIGTTIMTGPLFSLIWDGQGEPAVDPALAAEHARPA